MGSEINLKMNDDKLIELVRSHVVLYDTTHPKYMDKRYKEKIWTWVGQQMKHEATACKQRWNNMRDNYRKTLIKRLKSGRHSSHVRKYRYEDNLSFLRAFFRERINIGFTIVNDTLTQAEEYNKGEDKEIYFEEPSKENDSSKEDNLELPAAQQLELPAAQQSASQFIPVLKRKRKHKSRATDNSTLKKYNQEKYTAQSRQATATAIDAFLAGLAATLKNFTPYYLNLAKTEIFSAVQKYELAMIMAQDKSSVGHESMDEESSYSSDTSSPPVSVQSMLQSPQFVTINSDQQCVKDEIEIEDDLMEPDKHCVTNV